MILVAFLVVIYLAGVSIMILHMTENEKEEDKENKQSFILCSDDHLYLHATQLCKIVDQYNIISFIIISDSLEEFIPEGFTLKEYFLNTRCSKITNRPHWVGIGRCCPKQIFWGRLDPKMWKLVPLIIRISPKERKKPGLRTKNRANLKPERKFIKLPMGSYHLKRPEARGCNTSTSLLTSPYYFVATKDSNMAARHRKGDS